MSEAMPNPPSTPKAEPPSQSTGAIASKGRTALIFAVFAVLMVAGVGGYLWWRHHSGIRTDDAFVRADISQVAPEVGGRLTEVHVVENGPVQKGAPVVTIDPESYQLRVDQATAAKQAAEADVARAEGAAEAAEAQVRLAEAKLADAVREEKLQEKLVKAGSSVQAVLDRARSGVQVARQGVAAAQQQAQAAQAGKTAAQAHVASASTALAMAERDLHHTTVVAPVSGLATRVDIVAGGFVRPGQPLFAVVPNQVYVVANYKETQVADIHVGDPVDVWIDAYPGEKLTGKVQSLGAGTSASFSLLPADNPSGNFVKVVQRVPVRIDLDQSSVDGKPLSVGLSVLTAVHPGAGG